LCLPAPVYAIRQRAVDNSHKRTIESFPLLKRYFEFLEKVTEHTSEPPCASPNVLMHLLLTLSQSFMLPSLLAVANTLAFGDHSTLVHDYFLYFWIMWITSYVLIENIFIHFQKSIYIQRKNDVSHNYNLIIKMNESIELFLMPYQFVLIIWVTWYKALARLYAIQS